MLLKKLSWNLKSYVIKEFMTFRHCYKNAWIIFIWGIVIWLIAYSILLMEEPVLAALPGPKKYSYTIDEVQVS